jgi:hypothetical protein
VFQTVRVDPDRTYEFQGYVQPDPGVVESYLRISWYASLDGSGTALATDDSTARVAGSSGGFVYLTTGGRTPPRAARSARLRVMLAPASAAPATVHLDDFSFGIAPPSAVAPPPSSVVAPDDPPEILEASAVPAASPTPAATTAPSTFSATAVSTSAPVSTATTVSEILPLVDIPAATWPAAESPLVEAATPGSEDGPGILVTLLAASGVGVITLGGSYLLARHRRVVRD